MAGPSVSHALPQAFDVIRSGGLERHDTKDFLPIHSSILQPSARKHIPSLIRKRELRRTAYRRKRYGFGCRVCRDLEVEWWEYERDPFAGPFCEARPEALRATAAKGCPSCLLLHDGLAPFTDNFDNVKSVHWRPEGVHGTKVSKCEPGEKRPLSVGVYYPGEELCGPENPALFFEFYVHEDTPSPWSTIGVGREVSDDSSSDFTFALARQWFKTCASSHPLCRLGRPSALPTRVIYVGSETDTPYLYISEGETASYTALSYCWGDAKKNVRTTGSTFENFQWAIHEDLLPETIQDAMLITRSLRIPFLWVDSLCIIQDSREDWEAEAARMSAVYEGAAVVIAASGSADSRGGCFPRTVDTLRSAAKQNVLCMPCLGPQGRPASVYVRRVAGGKWSTNTTLLGPGHHGLRASDDGPLSTRAWTLQEALLARRILYYTSDELTWRCRISTECECRPYPRRVDYQDTFAGLMKSAKEDVRIKDKGAHEYENFISYENAYSKWRNMVVSAYMERSITYSTDRLAALSGLAARMQSVVKDEYLAGLWRRSLLPDLIWHVSLESSTEVGRISRRHKEYIAPSWSWASVDGVIRFHLALEPSLEIIDIQVGRVPTNPYGQVKAGSLIARASLIPVRFRKVDGGAFAPMASYIDKELDLAEKIWDETGVQRYSYVVVDNDMRDDDFKHYRRTKRDPPKSGRKVFVGMRDGKKVSLRCGLPWLDVCPDGESNEINETETYYLMHIGNDASFAHHFIALRKAMPERLTYKRVGCIWSYANNWNDGCVRGPLERITII